MPKHYESDKDPKLPPKTNNNYKKKDVFDMPKQRKAEKSKKPKKSKKSKKSKSKKSSY